MTPVKIIVLLILAFLVFGGGFLFFNSQKGKDGFVLPGEEPKTATISGLIGFNGTVPAGATISIGQRPTGTKDQFNMVVQNLSAKDGVTWSWNGAKENESYDVQAFLIENGQQVEQSEILTVSAPATDEVLHLNSDAGPAPTPNPQTNQIQPVTISGTFDLNGYYTTNTTITILYKIQGQGRDYQVAASGVAARDKGAWNWGGALADTTYEMKARFISSTGANIGESPKIIVTAPATGEVLAINSTAQPPAPAPTSQAAPVPQPTPAIQGGAISGTINFNGAVPANSSIVILAQTGGSGDYQVVVNGVQPSNGATWSWNGASAGQNYNLVAVLKQQNANNTQTDVARSQTMNTTAPAQNQQFTINSGVSLPAPQSSNISSICNSKNASNNTWSATLSFPSVANAQSYWYQIGTSSGSSNFLSTNQNAQNNPVQTLNVTINDSVVYYAQYAYSNVPNATWNSNSYSGFSPSYQFKCP